jgi:hypothetical protein
VDRRETDKPRASPVSVRVAPNYITGPGLIRRRRGGLFQLIRLGDIPRGHALVWPFESPIRQLDDRFHETSFDEANRRGTGSMLVDSLFEKS